MDKERRVADPGHGVAARVVAERFQIWRGGGQGGHAALAHEPGSAQDQRASACQERCPPVVGVEVSERAPNTLRRGEPRDDGRGRDGRRNGLLRGGFARADYESQDEQEESLTRRPSDHYFELT